MAVRMLRQKEQPDATSVVGAYVLGELSDRLANVQRELARTNEDIEILRAELDAARDRMSNG